VPYLSNAGGKQKVEFDPSQLKGNALSAIAWSASGRRSMTVERAIQRLIAVIVLSCDPLAIALTAAASARREAPVKQRR
jgi:hypothetical protein